MACRVNETVKMDGKSSLTESFVVDRIVDTNERSEEVLRRQKRAKGFGSSWKIWKSKSLFENVKNKWRRWHALYPESLLKQTTEIKRVIFDPTVQIQPRKLGGKTKTWRDRPTNADRCEQSYTWVLKKVPMVTRHVIHKSRKIRARLPKSISKVFLWSEAARKPFWGGKMLLPIFENRVTSGNCSLRAQAR